MTTEVKKPKAAKRVDNAASTKDGKKVVKSAAPRRPITRTHRLDTRVTKAQRDQVIAIAKKKGMTITEVVMAGIAKLK